MLLRLANRKIHVVGIAILEKRSLNSSSFYRHLPVLYRFGKDAILGVECFSQLKLFKETIPVSWLVCNQKCVSSLLKQMPN